jgi:biopolymer transport protein ExbB
MKILRLLRLVGALPLVLGLLAAPAAASAAALQEAGGHGNTKSWLELFETTGPVGYLMVACSVAGTTLVIEHMVSLRREKLAPAELAGELEALINEEEYDQAITICDENPGYMANIIGSALRMRDAGYQEMIAGLEAAANEETFKLNTKISYLSLIGNVAPLLGLLGTVTGMMTTFDMITVLGSGDPGIMAGGIYEALITTVAGLVVAIPLLLVHSGLSARVDRLVADLERYSASLVNLLREGTDGRPR